MEENNNQQINIPKEPTKKEDAKKAGKDLGEVAATAAGNYLGGPVGGMVANKIAQSKLGQQTLGKAADGLAKNPITKKALAKAQPAIEKSKPALNAAVSNKGGSASGTNGVDNSNSSSSTSSSSNKSDNNSSNSGFGNNKSGLFSNKKTPSSKGKSSNEGSKGVIETFKKAKKVIGIISSVAPIALPITFIVIIAVVVMAQIMTVRDNITQLVQQFTTGVEKLINFAQGDGWMTNEDSFFNYLDKEYRKFPSTTASSDQLDIPLIAATIHYSKTVDVEKYEENTDTSDSSYTSDNFEELGSALTKDQTVSFYKVAKDKLGSVNTIWPGQKRLLGHVVQTNVTVQLVDWNACLSYWGNFFSYLSQTTLATAEDLYWETPLQYANPIGAIIAFINLYNEIQAYVDIHGDALAGLKYDQANLVYEAKEFLYSFKQLFTDCKDSKAAYDAVPEEDKNSIVKFPAPVVVRKMNYGHAEYKQMQEDLASIRAILSSQGITTTTRKDALKEAKNSSDQKLKDLHQSYTDNENSYMYSYTHYLQNVYIPFTYFYNEEYNLSEVDSIVDEIYDQRDFYNYLIGEDFNYGCGGSCVYQVGDKEINNLKVRLMQCSDGTWGEPIPGEELVDFEKYILGVVYAEIGDNAPTEAAKVQAIAARSYALTRPEAMGNAAGLSLAQEDGNWILSIRNCTEDQVYCDPDKGCSNTTNPSSSGNDTTVYSGANTKAYKYKGPLAADAPIRSAVSAVVGQVLLDDSGKIVRTGYVNSNQETWASQANSGMDHTEILLANYTTGTTISNGNCSNVCNAATGDFTQWKQYDTAWSSVPLGNSTIGGIGCTATSIAIQIARSGVPLTIPELNPGTFVEKMSENEGFVNGGNLVWAKPSVVAPTFVHQGSHSLAGLTQATKASKVQSLIDQGCYLVMEVKQACGNGQHWVAVDYVSGGTVYIMDPGSTSNTWDKYGASCAGTLQCYKVTG